MYISGYRNVYDRKYYVPVIVQSTDLIFRFRINFLIDTGASRTQISWIDAHSAGIIIRILPKDKRPFTGLGGSVDGYLLQQSKLYFKSDLGTYQIFIENLSVSDYETTDGRPCPKGPSLLGIDIIDRFHLLLEDTKVVMRNRT